MLRHLDEVYSVLNAFCQTSGIGAICFDAQLNFAGCRPAKSVINDFLCLGTDEITRFLADKMEGTPSDQPVFYTYILDGNLASVIVPVARDGLCLGAFVTQPVFLKTPTAEETDTLIGKIAPVQPDKEAMKTLFRRVPVRSFEKLGAFGTTLGCLTQSIFGGQAFAQILCGEATVSDSTGLETDTDANRIDLDEAFPVRQLRFADYLNLKEGIQDGNTAVIDEVANGIVNGSMPTHQLDRRDYLRSLKDSYIKVCAMACYAAIEANAPYYKLLDMADENIRQMEKHENAYQIFDLMKTTLYQFAHAVKVSRVQTHSKAVRQTLDYIDAHFDEKITLELLAEHTGLSTFYLSSLIKKETGLILTDNVNAVRIEKSKRLLLDESLNVIDVAHRVGFSYQNHFSTVFKKFTGMTPSDYVKAMGKGVEMNGGDKRGGRTVEMIIEQLRKTLAMLPEMYDAARVVDPRSNTAWALKTGQDETMAETCFDFWQRGAKCENCISQKAYLSGSAAFKIEPKGGSTYIVAAIPKTVNKSTYVIEVLKKVGSNSDTGPDAKTAGSITPELYTPGFPFVGNYYTRRTLDKKLREWVRRSRLENRPFSIILSLCENYADDGVSTADLHRAIVARHAQNQALFFEPDSCFVGVYTGDISLLALGGAGQAEACRIAGAIENEFNNMVFSPDGQARFYKFYSGVQTLTDDIADEHELVSLALMELNAKIEGRTNSGN